MKKSIKKLSAVLTLNKLMTKKRILVILALISSFILGASELLRYFWPIHSLGKQDIWYVLLVMIVENAVIGISCFIVAIILTNSVIKRNNELHFINLPSLAFAVVFFYGGLMMLLEIATLWYKNWWLAVILRLIVAISCCILAVGTVKRREYLEELPDVNHLQYLVDQLEKRVDLLKSTNPYIDEDSFTSGELLDIEILSTIKNVTKFLGKFETPTSE